MRAETVKADATKFFGLFVSRSGAGKSVAAMSFKPEDKAGEVFDFDMRKGYIGVPFINLKGWEVTQFPPLTTYMSTVEERLVQFNTLFQAKQWPIICLVVDGLGSMCRILLTDSLEYTKGNTKGQTRLAGPPDYNYQSQALLQIFDYLRSLPCHVIVTAHLVDKYGPGTKTDREGKLIEYQDQEVVGEQIAGITNKLAEIIPGYFDEIYKFSKSADGKKHYVEFYSNLARTVFNFPRGPQDITGKNFYQYWLSLVKKATENEIKK